MVLFHDTYRNVVIVGIYSTYLCIIRNTHVIIAMGVYIGNFLNFDILKKNCVYIYVRMFFTLLNDYLFNKI